MARFIFSFAMVLLLAFSAFADTVRLKNGSMIKGRITGFADGKFTITIGDGARQRTLTFSADEIESIEFDSQPSVAANTRRATEDVRVIPAATANRPSQNSRVVTSENLPRSGQTAQQRPPAQQPPAATPQQRPAATSPPASRITKPVELTVTVLADDTSNGWTNSGWIVKKGQRIKITGDGEVSLGNGKKANPGGLYDLEDANKLMQPVPTGALIAVIGDDNNDFIYVGREREFVAARDGALFLGLNEGNLADNKGAFTVKIEILPGD
jgi:hypothetical protein